ncbi:MAG TPA: MFS transporter [Xanthobacteraceae bacterium]|nr:MFS transporter [Xanthobacteraceae bacterium]
MGGLFANRWLVVIASLLGLLVGAGPVLIFSSGVFLRPVTADLGITRGDLSAGVLLATFFTALSCPIVGWLLDRYGTRRVMIPGIILYALVVACFGFMQTTPAYLIPLIFVAVGFVGGVQTPIPYAAVVAQWFDRQRGLALGIATAGVGLGVALLPPFLAWMIDGFGWRHAYFGLGIAVFVLAWLPVALFVREPPGLSQAARRQVGEDLTAALPGTLANAAFKQWEFWALSVAFFLGVMAINGTLYHLVPLLMDRGVPLQLASRVLSGAGIAIIFGRIIAGWCLDRFWGPYVAICFFISPMVGIALLISGATGFVPLIGAILCGAGIGAEIDLMAFFLSRYFGLKAYGKIYGVMFAIFNIGTGVGPWLSGRTFDVFHAYGPIFIVYEVALAITCLLFVRLGPYPYPAPKREDIPAVQQKAAA